MPTWTGNGRPRRGLENVTEGLRDALRKGRARLIPAVLLIVIGVIGSTGAYSVGPGEQAVVRTFGRETGKSGPGLHYIIPFVQKVNIVNMEQIRRLEVGFRGDKEEPHEALMITGDANIVEVQMIVQYRVSDATKYLFRIKDPDNALRATAEVALRSMVGRSLIDDVITTGREKVQNETRTWLQRLMDDYQSGISVTEVKLLAVDAPDEVRDAFHDVVRAREEKEKLINQALGYKADMIPRARGEARKIERDAEAYKEQRVLRAKGDAAKFDVTLAEYQKAARVTRERLYLETMERILGRLDRTILVDRDISRSVLPLLPLGAAAAVAAQPAAPAPGKGQ